MINRMKSRDGKKERTVIASGSAGKASFGFRRPCQAVPRPLSLMCDARRVCFWMPLEIRKLVGEAQIQQEF